MSRPDVRERHSLHVTRNKEKRPVSAWSESSTKRIEMSKMGLRNSEIRPVGAWAQPEIPCIVVDSVNLQNDVQRSAAVEEQRIRQAMVEKQEKLLKFQEDVKKRVKHMTKLKKHQQVQKSTRFIQAERNVLKKALWASPKHVKCGATAAVESRLGPSPSKLEPETAKFEPLKQLEDQNYQQVRQTREARNKLVSRKVVTSATTADDLPGGHWKDTWGDNVGRDAGLTMNSDDNIPAVTPGSDFDADSGLRKKDSQKSFASRKSVTFDLGDEDETRLDRIRQRTAAEISGTDLERPLSQPQALNPHLEQMDARLPEVPGGKDIHTAMSEEEIRTQARNQRALYRRLFMDIEREQVKENKKIKQQRMKIARIKKEVEEERQRQERNARELTLTRDPVTGETPKEKVKREEMEVKRIVEKNTRVYKKAKEIDRYIEALKANLGLKADLKHVKLPLLCCCATSFWDTNPDTCANNCQFYRNPKAYAKALQTLLQSCDLA